MDIKVPKDGVSSLNPNLAVVSNVEKALSFCSKCDVHIQTDVGASLLPCFHTLCRLCASSDLINGKLMCAKCKQVCNASETMDHFLLPYIKAKPKKKNCNNCNDNSVAQYRCVECDDFLCIECSRAHQRVKITMGHQLHQLEIPDSSYDDIVDGRCQIHQEDISWYCVSCDINTCRTCLLENHSGHQYRSFEEYLENYLTEMKSILEDNCKKLPYVHQVISLANQRIQDVSSNESAIRAELHRAVDQIHESLANRTAQIYNRLECLGEEKRKIISEIKGSAEKIESISQQLSRFVEASMSCSNRLLLTRLFRMTKCALKRLDQLKIESGNVGNIMNATSLALVLPTNDILARIQAFGDLITDQQQHIILSPPPPPPPGPHLPNALNQKLQRNPIPTPYYEHGGYGLDCVQYSAANFPFFHQGGKLPNYMLSYRTPQPSQRNWTVEHQSACRFSNFNQHQQIQYNRVIMANVREGLPPVAQQQQQQQKILRNQLPAAYFNQQYNYQTNLRPNFPSPPRLHYGPSANVKSQHANTPIVGSSSAGRDETQYASNTSECKPERQSKPCSTAGQKTKIGDKQWYDRNIHSITSAQLSSQLNNQKFSTTEIATQFQPNIQPICHENSLPAHVADNEHVRLESINVNALINKPSLGDAEIKRLEEYSNASRVDPTNVNRSTSTTQPAYTEGKARKSILRSMKTSYIAVPSKIRKIGSEAESEIPQNT